jgi:uroporphyrinogen-III synthase
MAMTPDTSGKAIAACGTAATAKKLADGLHAAGLKARAFPLVRIAHREDWNAGLDFDRYEWIVLSSPMAAQLTLAVLGGIYTGRFACVGEATAAVVKAAGFSVAVVASPQSREGLLQAFRDRPGNGQRLLLPLSDASPNDLWDGLRKLRYNVDAPVVYKNAPEEDAIRDLARAVAGGDLCAAALTSASAVAYAAGAPGIEALPLYCIGPSTAEAVWKRQWKVAAVAEHHSVGGLIKTIRAAGKPNG